MSYFGQITLATVIYRCALIGAGVFCVWIGYCLYRFRINRTTGDIKIKTSCFNVALKATPEILLSFFGASLIGFAVWQGPEVKFERGTTYFMPPEIGPIISKVLECPSLTPQEITKLLQYQEYEKISVQMFRVGP